MDSKTGQPTSPASADTKVDFFISRRGASAAVAQEVAQVLIDAQYTVLVQDFDFQIGENFIERMNDALKRARHLVVLLTKDYDRSYFTALEVFNFLAIAARPNRDQRIIVLRLDDIDPTGVLAGIIFEDLVGVDDPNERKRRILAAAEGRSPASPRRPKLFENVPQRDLNFIGRDDRLADLHRLLMNPEKPGGIAQAAIHGLGGVGKTSLAVEYAHRYAGQYAGVWWVPAERRTSLLASLGQLAGRLDPALATELDQDKAARAALNQIARGAMPFLLIYDNVESPEVLRDFVPSAGARVLITTRWSDWSGRAAEFKLDVLAPSAAAELLQKRSGRTDPDGAGRLAEELGFLPLALDHAGAYCALDRLISFDVYRQKFHSRLAYVPPGAPYPISVAKSFDLAIEKAVATCSAAERLLGVCAYLAPERIPVDVISQVIREEGERAKALMALSGVSLIGFSDADEGLPTVSIHRLVQAAMRTRHYLRKQTDTEVQLAVTCLVAAMKTPKPISDETLDSTDKAYWYQLWALLPYTRLLPARKLGSTKPLHLYAKATVEFSDKLLPHAGLPPSVEYRELLADVLCAAGNFREAEQEYRRALQIAEGVLGHDHPKVASMLLNHGLRCVGRKNSEADRLFREALAIAERTLGTESPLAIHCRQINYYLSTRGRMRGFPKGMFMLLFWPLPANQADEDLAVGIAQYGVGAASLGLLYDLLLSWKEGTGVAFANLGAHLSLSAQIGLSISLSFFGAYLIFRLWRKRMSVGIAWASLIYFFVICDLGYLLIVGLYTVPLFLVVGVFLTKFMVDVVIAAYSLRRHLVPH